MAKIYFDNHSLDLARAKIFNSLNNEEQINLFDVVELSSGDYLPKSKMEDGKYKVYGGGGLTQSTHTAFNIEFETVGIGRVGARCGCAFIIEKKSWVTDNALFVSKFKKKYDLSFLTHYLNHINLNQFANQSAQPVISQRGIAKCTIPDIDYYKQQEIGVILNAIEKGEDFEDVYNLKTVLEFEKNLALLYSELDQQQTYLQLLRQTILQEAVQGKLTKQDPTDEPATGLLKRIKAEKEKLIKAGKLKKERELSPITEDEIPFELPEGWAWCRLGEIITFTDNLNIETKLPKDTLINYVDIDAIDNQHFVIRETKQRRVSELSSRARRVLKKGYIVYSLVRPYLNNIAIVEDDKPNYIGSTGFAVFNGVIVDNYYLKILLLSDFIRIKYLEILKGFNSPSITQEQFTSTFIPLPPLAEQQRIVAKVQQLQQQLSLIEAQVQQSRQYGQQLLQSVLKEAFVGKGKVYGMEEEKLSIVAEE